MKNLRGAMTWAIDLDDITSYPLLNTLKCGLKDYRTQSTISGEGAETTVEISTTGEETTKTPSTTPEETTETPSTTPEETTTETPSTTPEETTEPPSTTSEETTMETPSTTLEETAETTPESSVGCTTGEYVSVDARATNDWCQSNCEANEQFCLSTKFCVCSN